MAVPGPVRVNSSLISGLSITVRLSLLAVRQTVIPLCRQIERGSAMRLPPALRHRDFNLYWFGVVFSQIGTRGTVAANLYQVYELSRSTALTGLVGLAQAVSLLVLSPLGGAYADRRDRRRPLQATQLLALVVAAGLAVVTELGRATVAEVLACVLLTTAAGAFDQPARQALIPAMVPRDQLPQAF